MKILYLSGVWTVVVLIIVILFIGITYLVIRDEKKRQKFLEKIFFKIKALFERISDKAIRLSGLENEQESFRDKIKRWRERR